MFGPEFSFNFRKKPTDVTHFAKETPEGPDGNSAKIPAESKEEKVDLPNPNPVARRKNKPKTIYINCGAIFIIRRLQNRRI